MQKLTRRQHNERFLQRLLARRPQDRQRYEEMLRLPAAAVPPGLEGVTVDDRSLRDRVLETIVDSERPVLFVRDGQFDTKEVTTLGPEAVELVEKMKAASPRLLPMLPLIGRIDVENFPGSPFLGTGWFVDTDLVVTNRHVASLIARWDGRRFVFSRGMGGRFIESSVCNAHEFDDLAPDAARVFKVKEVLYIEPDSGPHDIAFLRVERRTDGSAPPFIQVAPADVAADVLVCVIGYPARAPQRVIPDQALMQDLYRGKFDVKRAAPGFAMGTRDGTSQHDCTTLGGNSGSVVLDPATSRAVGLHFAGLYKEANYAVRASVLTDYIRRKRWNQPPQIETRTPARIPQGGPQIAASLQTVATSSGGAGAVTIPLTITVSLGAPGAGGATIDSEQLDEAVRAFWDARPDGVLAARVGYFDDGDHIGDQPCIAVSVRPNMWAAFESTGPREFHNVPIRYLPADVDEQIQAMPEVESVDSIAYDDDARKGEEFSFAPINEPMDVRLHVGPEYSWDVLHEFLSKATGRLVSAMYEFHAPHIKDALEERLKKGASLKLVLDNATFSKLRDPDEGFDRVAVFKEWARRFPFERVVAPEGTSGLISDSYHIKVTVREDDTFWLSSGNWKMGSSQPPITQDERDNATNVDLPGNREWHVVIKNTTLATRFRHHILQDFKRSEDLGGGPVSPSLMEEETFVDVPIEEAVVLERRPPSRLVEPMDISRPVKVRPLLTPDREGEIYSEAVLDLIRSARRSLLFQIPYIGMPQNPREDRGYIDELIKELTRKLTTLSDARLLLRSGGAKFSNPAHAAWYFKSKGVDIANRVHMIENHHTKGMIVDGRRVLLGSHNWSKPGVTLNRDASLIFDDADVAAYYARAFEIDWDRSDAVRPKRYVKPEGVVREAVGAEPPPGYRRISLAEWLKDD